MPQDQLSTKRNEKSFPRRDFLKSASLGTLALALPFSSLPAFLKDMPMGIVVHSYAARWHSKADSQKYPAFDDAIELMEHSKSIGAGGIQVTLNGWSKDFGKQVRAKREQLDMYLEGSIGLPKSTDQIADFEKEVLAAKEAGASVLRTACLSGRRYVNFHTKADFLAFKKNAIRSIELAEPIVRKHKMKLAVENHKDWAAEELVQIIKSIGSEWVGVTLDFGNNVSFLEKPMEVIKTLAPYAFSTHVKDMGIKEYPKGFLLSEVPLGEGVIDLKAAVEMCRKYNPDINFSLEMITRDPLEIPYLTEGYWATFDRFSPSELEQVKERIAQYSFEGELPQVTGLSAEQQLAFEEENVQKCLAYSRSLLHL
ncbi:TIM barrel protein [Algoriphagus halophytocola]|uniref:sugar phosphate isomerase/epimerase family protein n=1 Tax=Algoriphagus halophytocola TaxID=2991499 RepID=UPI0022DD7798|nr:TIM barrel protein [Algoriphagus sp. TR-M9]WBL43906.1 TIM barrel protein [Algoriphagus sp. TR-M9]